MLKGIFRFFSPKSVCTTCVCGISIDDRALFRLSRHALYSHNCTCISKAFCLDISIAGSTGNRHHVASAPSGRVRFQYKSKLLYCGSGSLFCTLYIQLCRTRNIVTPIGVLTDIHTAVSSSSYTVCLFFGELSSPSQSGL